MPLARDGPETSARAVPRRAAYLLGRHAARPEDLGGSTQQSTIVVSTPIGQAPPSRITSKSGSSRRRGRRRTCAAVVGLTLPKRFADGAARRRRAPRSARGSSGWAGTRTPTDGRRRSPRRGRAGRGARALSAGPASRRRPGARPLGGTSRAQSASWSTSARWTISGCPAGRPLTAKIRRTAAGFVASAASPYTVSVGMRDEPAARRSPRPHGRHRSSGEHRRIGVEELERGVDEAERVGRGEVVDVAQRLAASRWGTRRPARRPGRRSRGRRPPPARRAGDRGELAAVGGGVGGRLMIAVSATSRCRVARRTGRTAATTVVEIGGSSPRPPVAAPRR